jgi:hypothetical protein
VCSTNSAVRREIEKLGCIQKQVPFEEEGGVILRGLEKEDVDDADRLNV